MDNSAMASHITDEVIGVLVDQGIVHAVRAEDLADDVMRVIEKQLDHLLSEAVGLVYLDRVQKAMRVLAGPNGMEQAVAQNRRGMGLPPQCIFCDCAPDQHRDWVAPDAPAS